MSTRDTGTNVPGDKPKGLAKFKRRVSRILGKDDVKRANMAAASSSTATTGPPASTPAPAKSEPTSTPLAGAAESKAAPEVKPVKVSIKPRSAKTAVENAEIQEEKVRAMFAKYGMTLDVGDWTPPFKTDIPRVEKKVRVRIHRTCHRCQTQYGVDTVCNNCSHKRCKKCPRYPGPKKETIKGKEGPAVGAAGYVKRPVTQRTRKICHECKTPFKSKASQCEKCQHTRCDQCTRDSPKSASAPGGAAAGTPSLSRNLWTCHDCKNVHRDPENPCLKCGHSKCAECPRDTLKKAVLSASERGVPLPSGGGVEGVEDRMKTIGVTQASAA